MTLSPGHASPPPPLPPYCCPYPCPYCTLTPSLPITCRPPSQGARGVRRAAVDGHALSRARGAAWHRGARRRRHDPPHAPCRRPRQRPDALRHRARRREPKVRHPPPLLLCPSAARVRPAAAPRLTRFDQSGAAGAARGGPACWRTRSSSGAWSPGGPASMRWRRGAGRRRSSGAAFSRARACELWHSPHGPALWIHPCSKH